MLKKNDILLSVVIPVYNEKDSLIPLAEELKNVLDGLGRTYEIIWVDDGSSDGSFDTLRLSADKDNFRVVRFSRNYGQTAAMSEGINSSRGEWIVTLDADGQNDPADIPLLLETALSGGYDVVSGYRKNRRDPFFSRRLPSVIANRIISAVTGVRLRDSGCTLKIYRADLLKSIDLYGEMHRFIPALMHHIGASITEIPVNHRPRMTGRSKYGIMRTFKVCLDLITVKFRGEFASKPAYFFGGMGVFLWIVSAFMAAWTLYNRFFNGIYVKDQPLFLLAGFCALAGLQMVFTGILADMITRNFYHANKDNFYRVSERIN